MYRDELLKAVDDAWLNLVHSDCAEIVTEAVEVADGFLQWWKKGKASVKA